MEHKEPYLVTIGAIKKGGKLKFIGMLHLPSMTIETELSEQYVNNLIDVFVDKATSQIEDNIRKEVEQCLKLQEIT